MIVRMKIQINVSRAMNYPTERYELIVREIVNT